MKSQPSLGLVVEGNATSSAVLRLPSLVEELGPIKAGTLRVARRLSNYLHAGYGVGSYKDLRSARLVFLRVPDASASRIVEEICRSELIFKGVCFVLCESCLSSKVLDPLQGQGAFTATLTAVQTLRKNWFVIEGQLSAVRQVKKFLQRNDARVFDLRPDTKSLYFAAQLLASALPIQLLATAQQALRLAGISGNHLYDLLEEMSSEMFRCFSNGVRLSWPAARTGCLPDTCFEYLEQLRSKYPQIASVVDEQMALTSRLPSLRNETPNI